MGYPDPSSYVAKSNLHYAIIIDIMKNPLYYSYSVALILLTLIYLESHDSQVQSLIIIVLQQLPDIDSSKVINLSMTNSMHV